MGSGRQRLVGAFLIVAAEERHRLGQRAGLPVQAIGRVRRLLDQRVGSRFALFGTTDAMAAAAADPRWRRDDVTLLGAAEQGESLHAWLAGQRAAAALLRPDRYLADVADSPMQLERLAACLPGG